MVTDISSADASGGPENAARVSREGDRTILWLEGELDIANNWLLADTMAKAIALDDGDLVVDLSETAFIGGATVDVLLRGRTFLLERERALTLRAPSSCARRVIDLCGLTALVDPP